jgi:ferrous iron transport protein B
MTINISDLQVGEYGKVTGFEKDFTIHRQKLLAMGLTPGTEFQIIRVAPLGNPVEIRVRGNDLSLRKNEVTALNIERLEVKSEQPAEPHSLQPHVIGIIGNPNCGKTTLFNGLTGARQHVGNWAGVTVERKTGQYQHHNDIVQVVDLPGIYSLDVHDSASSLDEKVALDYILSREADLIINVIDSTHLERSLYLTLQLLEMHLPVLVVLNIMEDASGQGIHLDVDEIAKRLNCPLMAVIATQRSEVKSLQTVIAQQIDKRQLLYSPVSYGTEIQTAIDELLPLIENQITDHTIEPRWLALKLLEGDDLAKQYVNEELDALVNQQRQRINQKTNNEIDILVADSRYVFINKLTQDTLTQAANIGQKISDGIDRIVLNRFLGIPIFFAVMYFMFTFTIHLGRAFKPFFKNSAQALFVDGPSYWLGLLDTPQWLISIVAGGIGKGIMEVIAFVPILGFLYLFISVLEESGYMARATFVMDRFMQSIGLPGKAFVPMILGFGCNVPAMMATRTMERPRDRLLTILLNPFMTCGARLAVFTLFAAAFFPENGQVVVFSLYLIGVVFAVLTALLMKNTVLKEEFSLVVMEIPNYHIPKLKNVLINSWTRVKGFIVRVGKIIITMVLVLNILSSLGTDGSFGKNGIENSVLSAAGKAITPVLAPMGIRQDNWPATVAVFTGVLHKVVVISTLKTIYAETGGMKKGEPETFNLLSSLKQAVMTIPMGLKKMLGLGSGKKSADSAFFFALHSNFQGQIGAFAYLLFVLLYFPCIATTSTAYKESHLAWATFMVGWSTGLAYLTATLFYQIATFSNHPGTTIIWVGIATALIISVIVALRFIGSKQALILLGNGVYSSSCAQNCQQTCSHRK